MHKIYHYPKASEINPGLTDCVKEHCFSYKQPEVLDQFPYNDASVTQQDAADGTERYKDSHKNPIAAVKGFKGLYNWIDSLVLEATTEFNMAATGSSPFDIGALSIYEYWGMYYRKGSQVLPHNHFPNAISFAYYCCCPGGSSPLIVEDKEVAIEEGQLIFFPAYAMHSVPVSPVEGRTMISGNIVYQPSSTGKSRKDRLPEQLRNATILEPDNPTEGDVPKEMEHLWMTLKQQGIIDAGKETIDRRTQSTTVKPTMGGSFADWVDKNP